ncbi:SDR family NAD(P)-dependent oxidoreductase [Paenibacillus sp. FSL P4-0081]|uniref:SDR family NAD(P)-dependent oxidoreductase n=1 Tax=Paenibacillus sp. FSL P4-0081 TaxID=1536769 RepID=UPI000694173D|nr:SDR family NAD(P)-dependent oxidoreductase [Paenibacillus sp. FSL P4-0081]
MRSIIERIASGAISKEEGLRQIAALKRSDKQVLLTFTKTLAEQPLTDLKGDSLGHVLVLAADRGLEPKLRGQFASLFQSLTFVTADEAGTGAETGQDRLPLQDQEDYTRLLSGLERQGCFPGSILHLLSQEEVADGEADAAMESGVYTMFALTKALLSFKKRAKVNILFQYKQAENHAVHAALDGFVKSVMIENPGLLYKTVSTDLGREAFDPQLLEQLLLELGSMQNGHREIHYRGSRRYVPVFERYTAPADHLSVQQQSPAAHPVYLITGGLGALGYTLARHLADTCSASLILTGRTPLNRALEEKLQALHRNGNQVRYVCADVASPADTRALLSEVKASFPRLHGILHCAGMTSDSFILHKEREELERVLAAKVAGTQNLYEAFGQEPLEFMLLFSSISAVTGNVGQCDYAYANSFMDHFANEKRAAAGVKILSVNWPLWQEGGMMTTADSLDIMRRNLGISVLPTAEGLDAFDKLSCQMAENALVLYGDAARIEQAVEAINYPQQGDKPRADTAVSGGGAILLPEASPAISIDTEALKQGAEQYLKNIFIKVTKIPPHALGLDDSFEKIGFDSIMAMSINEELEASFGELSKTLLFEYQTLRELSEYFTEQHREALAGLIEPPAAKKAAVPPQGLRSDVRPQLPGKTPIPPKRIQPSANAGQAARQRDRSRVNEDIAIVGVSGKFPMSPDLQVFWNNLLQAQDCITEIPADRWSIDEYYTTDKNQLGKMYCKWGGFLDDVDRFDALFFNISPREAEIMDPQERLFLECAYSAIEDAGYTRDTLGSRKVGVFAGVMYGQYQLLDAEIDGNKIALSSVYASIANRVSYHLNLNGPSIALDTMCSSSLTSIHLACDSIRRGESDFAIAGGVNVSIHPDKYIFLSQQKFAASDGRCRSFGEGGDGYVPGEGVGAVLLKTVDRAVQDGDHIYAVIKASSINHGGKTTGYTVPNPTMQGAVIQETLQAAGIHPRTVNYIEAHGTGTSLGDPIEVSGLVKAFKEGTGDKQFCAIGSVKSNIGHCESAAGIAAITKVLLQMKYGVLVPSLHSEELNGHINFEETPFYVQRQTGPWDRVSLPEGGGQKEYPRRAGVSSFGAGGANAHIILEEYIPAPQSSSQDSKGSGEPHIIVLSARAEDRLKAYALKLAQYLELPEAEAASLKDIAYTLQVGRESFAERLAIIAGSVSDLKALLDEFNQGRLPGGKVYRGNVKGFKDYIELFNAGQAGISYVDLLLDGGNTGKIAQLWSMGLDVDWRKLYESDSCTRVPLPTYPFARNRYWVSEVKRREIRVPALVPETAGMGELVEHNLSTIDGYRFSSRSAVISSFYEPYTWQGQEYMNGFGLLAFAREALELAGYKQEGLLLENMAWSGLMDRQQLPPALDIHIFPDRGTGAAEIRIGEQVVFQCEAAIGADLTVDAAYATKDIPEAGQGEPVLKQARQALRLLYGIESGLKHVTGLRQDKNILLAFVDLGEAPAADSLSAEAVNSACHTLLALAALEQPQHPAVLHSIRQMSFRHKPLQQFVIRAERIAGDEYTLAVLTGDGAVVWIMQGVRLAGLQAQEVQERETVQYYTTAWTPSPQESAGNLTGDVVLFLDDMQELPHFKRSFAAGARLIFVTAGEQYAQLGDNLYSLRFDDKQHIHTLLESLQARRVSLTQIIYLAASAAMKPQDKLNHSVYPLLFLTQALMESKAAAGIRLLYAFRKTGDAGSLLDASMGGFIKTLHLESPNYNFKTVSLAASLPQEELHSILEQELLLDPGEQEVQYSSAGRFVKRLVQAGSEAKPGTPVTVRANGVYIITGGLGGLGRVFAAYLAETAQAQLVLTGRSPLDREKEEKLAALRAHGGSAEYLVSDAADGQEAGELVGYVKQKYGRIDGILHCAGIHRDAFILNKDQADFDQVISSKILSTLNLDQGAQEEKLDFILLFSSITGETGNPGQADYAYANSFMNEFAVYRERLAEAGARSGRTFSVAWPLWEADGMQLTTEQRRMLELQTGLTPLPVQQGIAAFEYLLQQGNINPLIVGYGQPERVSRLLERINRVNPVEAEIHPEELEDSSLSGTELLDRTLHYLTELFSGLLKLQPEEIDITAEFEEYGIESVMVGYFNGKLEEDLGEISKTLLFEYQTLKSLAAHMVSRYTGALNKLFHSHGSGRELPEQAVSSSTADLAGQPVISAAQPLVWKELTSFSGQGGQRGTAHAAAGKGEEIAIIGLSGKYPLAGDIYEFWDNIAGGRDCIREIPADRWDYKKYLGGSFEKVQEGKMYSKWGGFLDDVDKFDPAFFNIAPREAVIMDPQERMFAETVWSALEDAGYTKKKLQRDGEEHGANIGVFAGATTYSYQLWGPEEWERGNLSAMPNVSPWSIANRISYMFNFSGPSLAIDTACSSSLAAIHAACESLKNKECRLAVAGGVNLYLHPYKYVLMCQTKMLSPTGKCHSFGDAADGFVPGEGVGAVLLKPLSEAIKDKDHIYGVIKATGINHGGKVSGYTVPNPNAQVSLISKVLKQAGVDASSLSYVEAHGTGTKLGDPIEINALNQVFAEANPPKQSCAIGSVKSNIGHLEAAAGIASITKVLLQMKHRKLAPSIHAEQTNANIDFANSYFRVQHEQSPWTVAGPDGSAVRRAGVSSFGAGGTNAYVLIEEYTAEVQAGVPSAQPGSGNGHSSDDQVIVLSAKTPYSLKQMAVKLRSFLEGNPDTALADAAYTLQTGREEMTCRLAFACTSITELQAKLDSYLAGENLEDIYSGKVSKRTKGTVLTAGDAAELAAEWVQGAEVEWPKLHSGEEVRIIPLPTYAFERERYWITRTESPASAKGGEERKLHPLVDRNLSSFSKQRYETILQASDRNSGLANTAFIELFRITAELSLESPCHVIEDVIWGVQPQPGAADSLMTSLYEAGAHIECETGYDNEQGDYVICAQGKVTAAPYRPAAAVTPIRMAELGSPAAWPAPNATAFQHIETIHELRTGAHQAAISVRLKEPLDSAQNRGLLHYSAVEELLGCLVRLAAQADRVEYRKLLRCTVLGPLTRDVQVLARWRTMSDGLTAVDISILDPQARVLMTMEELTLKLTGASVLDAERPVVPATV